MFTLSVRNVVTQSRSRGWCVHFISGLCRGPFFKGGVALRILPQIVLLLGFSTGTLSAAPQWWTQEWPAGSGQKLVGSGLTVNDYGVANLGQLKHAAIRAYYYMEATLPGGAGSAVRQRLEPFYNFSTLTPIVSPTTSDYGVLVQGQLKYLVEPFYNRLLESGYITWEMLRNQGVPGWSSVYPWTPTSADDQSQAPVLIGQLKLAFGFVLDPAYQITLHLGADTNNDFLDDVWVSYYGLEGYSWHQIVGGSPLYEAYRRRLDPHQPDTDSDGIPDVSDPHPHWRQLQVFTPAL